MKLKDKQIKAVVHRFRPGYINFSPMSEPYQVAQASEEAVLKAIADYVTDQDHIERDGNLYYLVSSNDCQTMFQGRMPVQESEDES